MVRRIIKKDIWYNPLSLFSQPSGLVRDDGKRRDHSTLIPSGLACRQVDDVGRDHS